MSGKMLYTQSKLMQSEVSKFSTIPQPYLCFAHFSIPILQLNDGECGAKPKLLLMADDIEVEGHVTKIAGLAGYQLQVLAEPDDLWEMELPPSPTCLLCSHPLRNGFTGFDVLKGIRQREMPLPTLIVAADWDLRLVVQAMKSGASDFLALPLDSERMRGTVEAGLQEARQLWTRAHAIADAKARIGSLDKREREVIRLVLNGFLNKEIAHHLNLAVVTIKVYRSRAMKKIGAGNPAELVRIAALAGMCKEEPVPRPE